MSLQLDDHGRLRHLLTLEGLPREVLCGLLDRAQQLCGHAQDPTRVRELLAGTALVNAGDGRSAHPTQGLLDMLTVRQAKGDDFPSLKVLVVGDIRVCGPRTLLPVDGTLQGCTTFDDLDAALDGVDVVMMLRLQRERMQEGLIRSIDDYHRDYGLTVERLRRAAPDAVVLHPGPMNRGVEIDDAVADGPQSLVLRQVANGVAVRMAVLESLLRR